MQARSKFVILRNKDRFRSFTFTLYHKYVCVGEKGGPGCKCLTKERIEPDRKGEYHTAERSVSLMPRKQSVLPPEVLDIPQVKAALDSGRLEEVTKRAPIQFFPGKE